MAEKKDEGKAEAPKKKLPMAMILQLGFVVLNLTVTGLGVYWVYAATLGWKEPSMKIGRAHV